MNELEYVNEVGKNPLLAYTLLHVIDKFQHASYIAPEIVAKCTGQANKRDNLRSTLTPSRFYRILFLINNSCEKKGLELRLPYYWYKSGPVIFGHDAPRVFGVKRIAKTQHVIASYGEWRDTVLVFDGHESSFSDAILLTLEAEKLARFTRLDVIFEYSPSKLHKILVTLISELQNITKKKVVEEKDFFTLAKLNDNIVATCSENRYIELSSSFKRAAEQIQIKLETQSNIHDVRLLIQEMWTVLSLALRARENENINEKQVEIWENKYMAALLGFEQQF